MSESLILTHVTKTFHGAPPVRAVDDVTLTIRENEFFTLLGPSGCGKTTLLRLIAGLDRMDAGRITLSGKDITHAPAHQRPVNTVFQNYALFPHMTVEENVGFGPNMRGLKDGDAITNILRLVRMDDMRERKPDQLSGGQQQRVALARALVNRPKVLLLDESLSALDRALRQEMQDELKRLQHETKTTFVFVTHDQDEALSLSDRIAVMEHGRVTQVGTPRDIYDRPATRFIAGFVGACHFVPAARFFADVPGEIGLRPENVSLNGVNRPSAEGTVQGVSYRGAKTCYRIALTDGGTLEACTEEEKRVGDVVRAFIDPTRVIRCVA